MKNIVIIGAGFSGSMTAVHLIRHATSPFRLYIAAGKTGFARGVAYRTWSDKHLLNVTAAGMSAFADCPDHFTDWVTGTDPYRQTDRGLIASAFLPRNLYGDYLEGIWEDAISKARNKGIEVQRSDLSATGLDAAGPGYHVHLEDHSVLPADVCIIATGNNTPVCPPPLNTIPAGDPRYVANPWEIRPLPESDPDRPILIIGNGLTMADTVSGLLDTGFRGTIHTLSRHGFAILPHRHPEVSFSNAADMANGAGGLSGLATRVFEQIRVARRLGYSAEPVVNALRPHVQTIWQNLSEEERQTFFVRLRPYWDMARHRIPWPVRERILKWSAEGHVNLLSGSLTGAELHPGGFRVHYRDRKTNRIHTLDVSAVINCTGPSTDIKAGGNLFLKDCLAKGHIVQDPLKLGILANPQNFAVQDRGGRSQENLRTLGPLLKGVLWETTAVREIRSQAESLARDIASSLSQ